MKVLITGSTGFVGRHLLDKLSNDENIQLILPVRNKNKIKNLNLKNAKILSFTENLDEIVVKHKPDVVINLLGIITEIPEKNITFEKVHYEYSKKLIDGAKLVNAKLFIQMSALGADINSKSRYQKTKALAENYLKDSKIPYFILRPSIILGEGQKLFEDLKNLSKIFPFLIAPKGKVQPVNIENVVNTFEKLLSAKEKNKIIELCGRKILSYKELFELVLSKLNIKKKVFEIDRKFLLPVAIIGTIFGKPITYDQWLMLEKDNRCI